MTTSRVFWEEWVFVNDITWMEKTVASPFWTGMMLFSIDRRRGQRRRHNLLEEMYAHRGRVCYKGQMFSAPMDWSSMMEQLKRMEEA